MFKINNRDTRTTSLTYLFSTLNIFYTFFSVSIFEFKQVNLFAGLKTIRRNFSLLISDN